MKPTIPLAPVVSVTLARPLATIQSWQVGQVLRAIALTASADGHAQLRIGSRTVQAQISVPVRAGQQLDLQVMKLGPQPVLQLLTAQNSDPVTAAIRLACIAASFLLTRFVKAARRTGPVFSSRMTPHGLRRIYWTIVSPSLETSSPS